MLDELFNPLNYAYNPHAVPIFLAGILIFLIGIFILLQTKKTVGNIAFFFFCMSLSLWLCPMGIVYLCKDPHIALFWYKSFVFFGVLNIMPNSYLFSVATAGFLKKQWPFVVAGFAILNIFYIVALVTDKMIVLPRLYYWGYYPHYLPSTIFFFIPYLMLFIASEANLWVAYKQEKVSVRKSQILIIFVGLLIGLLASVDFVAKIWDVPLYPWGFIPSFILSALVAFSIVKYKAFDIETVIHKTILWIMSFALIVIPTFLFYRVCHPLMDESDVLQVVFWIVSCGIFTVYLRVIQPKIDHIFQRRKADLDEISKQFVGNLVHLKGIDNLITYIEETITSTVYAQSIETFIYDEEKRIYFSGTKGRPGTPDSQIPGDDEFLLWLNKNDRIVYRDFVEIDPDYAGIREMAKRYFSLTGAMVVIPLVLNDRLLGVVNLGKKSTFKRYHALDFRFLETLRKQAAIAISNSLIYQNIERQVSLRTEELVDVQRQLVQAEKLATVGTLSGGVAHEINNPLTAILANVQMLLDFTDEDSVQIDREALELIEEATQRCRTIVQKLMAYAKKPLEDGETSKVDLSDILRKVIAFLHYQMEQDGIKLEAQLPGGECWVIGNDNELEQVLTNIILNAHDAIIQARKRGRIDISLARNKDQFEIEIRDDGGGIPEEVLSKIFDPFFTTKDVGKGLGLGLSICQSIIEKHHGWIIVEPNRDNGAVFTIAIPCYSKKAESHHVKTGTQSN